MIGVGCTVPSACTRCTVTGSLNRLLCKPSTRAGPHECEAPRHRPGSISADQLTGKQRAPCQSCAAALVSPLGPGWRGTRKKLHASWSALRDRKHLDRPETRPLPPTDCLWRNGELELRPSLEKRLQRAPALHARKVVP